MKSLIRILIVVLAACLMGGTLVAEESRPPEMPWSIGGIGGAYLMVEAGELEIEVFRRSWDVRSSRTRLQATLAGPDRRVVDSAEIPAAEVTSEDGLPVVQRVTLRASVDRPGIYALMITSRGNRYGLNLAWGLRTNATSYLIETSRGHRDERHQEPLVLLGDGGPAEVCFLPRPGAFAIEVEGLPADADPLVLYDETGAEVLQIPVVSERATAIRQYLRISPGDAEEGSARATVPAGKARGTAPWRLHLPQGRAYVNLDGLTRWESQDRYPDLCLWTPDPQSWFHFHPYRWLISPYQRTVWGEPGQEGQMTFRVHNQGWEAWAVDLSVEFCGEAWPAELDTDSLRLEPGQTREVQVQFTAPAEGRTSVAHIRATPRDVSGVTTYATLTVRGGESPVGQPLDLPLVLEPFAHENRQFGYLPDYAVDNQVYFDRENRPFVVAGSQLFRQQGGQWSRIRLADAVVRTVPSDAAGAWSAISTKVAFDADNDVYLLGRTGSTVALLHSSDGGETFVAYVLAGRESEPRAWDLEQFSGHNVPEGPPPVIRNTRRHRDTDPRLRWRSVNDLELFVGDKTADGSLVFQPPMLISQMALGLSMHSGIPSAVVSRGSQVHVVWGEATDPAISREEIPGVPAYAITYDRDTQTLGEPVFLSFGPPPNDGHNTPSITMDSQGYLHVVVGTHGAPFQYLRSQEPNATAAGWTSATRTSEQNLRQTYVGLVCGADDTLHLVFRLWRSGDSHWDGALWAALAYQSKPPGGSWSDPQVLVAPPLSEYSIYYHRLTCDREGRLFVSYDYWSTLWFYRNDQRGRVAAGSGRPGRGWGRAVLKSPDGGATWRLW